MNKRLNDLFAFTVVAEEKSFTRAAAMLSVSQSALSYTIKGLEERLKLTLFYRTTRSVSLTEAGQVLYESLGPKLKEIDDLLKSLNTFKDNPSGTIRITSAEHAASKILMPKVLAFMKQYPNITIEISVDYAFIDIVEKNYDAGVRLGESVQKNMIALPISKPLRMAVVATPDYFEAFGIPEHPHDLQKHRCINLRLATYGTMLTWEFEKSGKELNVKVENSFISNNASLMRAALLDGVGLAYLPEDLIEDALAQGDLIRVLEDWCEPFDGYYLYYPNRSDHLPVFSLFLDFMKCVKYL